MGKQIKTVKKKSSMNKQLMFIILIAIVVPPVLWLFHINSRPLPKTTQIDKVAGPPLEYSSTRLAHKDEIIREKYELASEDEDIATKLRTRSNPLYKSENVTVRYNKETQLFESEVTTISIEDAKTEAVNWFLEQGLTMESICVLPVTFTIDQKSADALRGVGVEFDPLASECY